MPEKIRLSILTQEIERTLHNRFEEAQIWVVAQITDVKKQPALKRCYLKFIEKNGADTAAEIKGVFWAKSYAQIENFEKLTGQRFEDGLEITCRILVRFNSRWGLSLEVQEIEIAYTLGSLELERQQTLERLVRDNPDHIRLRDGQYYTRNQSLRLPEVIQRIALVTAPNSDGQRDFLRELEQNRYGFAFQVTEFLTQIQGDHADRMILEKLEEIAGRLDAFDVVAIVRGGGSQTDFKPFDSYDLALRVASFQIPVFTGIGHDRNTSITDLMARQEKTPTKVAARIVDHNLEFENSVIQLKDRLFDLTERRLRTVRDELTGIRRMIRAASPETILRRGFALLRHNGKIITRPDALQAGMQLHAQLQNKEIQTTITDIQPKD